MKLKTYLSDGRRIFKNKLANQNNVDHFHSLYSEIIVLILSKRGDSLGPI